MTNQVYSEGNDITAVVTDTGLNIPISKYREHRAAYY